MLAAGSIIFGLLLYTGLQYVPSAPPVPAGDEEVVVDRVLEVQLRVEPKININKAAEEVLQTLPGIGPVLAERIVAYREEHGPFASPDELVQVTGIGRATLEQLRDRIVVE